MRKSVAKSRKQNRLLTVIVHRTRIVIVGPDRLIIAAAATDEVVPQNVNVDDHLVVVLHGLRIDVAHLTISTVTNGNEIESVIGIESEIVIVIAMEGEETVLVRTVPADRGLIQGRQPPREESHRNVAHAVRIGNVDRGADPNHLKTEDMVNTARIEEKNAAMTIVVNIGIIEKDRQGSTLTTKVTTAAAVVTIEVAHVVVAVAAMEAISHTFPGAMTVVTRKGHQCKLLSTISTAIQWARGLMIITTMINPIITEYHQVLDRAVCHHMVFPQLDTMFHRLNK